MLLVVRGEDGGLVLVGWAAQWWLERKVLTTTLLSCILVLPPGRVVTPMTLETMKAVVAELGRRAVPATLEYPGFICVTLSGASINFGDVNETFDGDLCDADGNAVESFESSIPSDSTDVQRIADFIACQYTAATEVRA